MECNRLASSDVEMQRMVEVMTRSMQMGTLASMFTQLGVGDLKWPPSNVSFPQSCYVDEAPIFREIWIFPAKSRRSVFEKAACTCAQL